MRRTFIGLTGNHIPGIEAAVIYLNRRGFEHYGERNIFPEEVALFQRVEEEVELDPLLCFQTAKGDIDECHAVLEIIRCIDDLEKVEDAARENNIKFLLFGIVNGGESQEMSPCLARADGIFFDSGNLEELYRQIDPFMEDIFE